MPICSDFRWILLSKTARKQALFQLCSKMPISQKNMVFPSKNTTFQVRSYRKSLQNLLQNAFEKNIVRKSTFDWILGGFWEALELQSGSKWPRKKSIENRSQNELPGGGDFCSRFVSGSEIHPPYILFILRLLISIWMGNLTRQTPTSGAADLERFRAPKCEPKSHFGHQNVRAQLLLSCFNSSVSSKWCLGRPRGRFRSPRESIWEALGSIILIFCVVFEHVCEHFLHYLN